MTSVIKYVIHMKSESLINPLWMPSGGLGSSFATSLCFRLQMVSPTNYIFLYSGKWFCIVNVYCCKPLHGSAYLACLPKAQMH